MTKMPQSLFLPTPSTLSRPLELHPQNFRGGVTNATKSGTWHGIVVVAKTIHVPNVAKLVILKSVVKLN
jgi:hypothetical protein